MDKENLHNELIQAFLQGEASEEQIRELEELMKSDEDFRADFERMKKLFAITDLKKELCRDADVEKNLQAFLKKKNAGKGAKVVPISKNNTLRVFIRVAAVLIIGLGIGYFCFSPEEKLQIVETYSSDKAEQKLQIVETYATDKAEQKLIDSTNVILNINSKLTYPEAFASDTRIVQMEGEAFFDVEPDEKPFVIHVGKGSIMVKGTAFNVNANNPDSIVVTVKEGSVLFGIQGTEHVLLEAGQKGTLMISSDHVESATNENTNYLFWYDGILTFEDATLKNVVSILNKACHLNIVISDKALTNCRITATYNNLNSDKILELLQLSLGVDIELQDEEISITGEGC